MSEEHPLTELYLVTTKQFWDECEQNGDTGPMGVCFWSRGLTSYDAYAAAFGWLTENISFEPREDVHYKLSQLDYPVPPVESHLGFMPLQGETADGQITLDAFMRRMHSILTSHEAEYRALHAVDPEAHPLVMSDDEWFEQFENLP